MLISHVAEFDEFDMFGRIDAVFLLPFAFRSGVLNSIDIFDRGASVGGRPS